MEKSNHKDYLEAYQQNRNAAIKNEILPYQENIFRLFSAKFNFDANKDLERKRKKLYNLWKSCWNKFDKIHSILNKKNENFEHDDEDVELDIVQDIVNMDYGSVEKFFNTLKEKYSDNPEIYGLLNDICNNISEMRRISKNHTNIISQ